MKYFNGANYLIGKVMTPLLKIIYTDEEEKMVYKNCRIILVLLNFISFCYKNNIVFFLCSIAPCEVIALRFIYFNIDIISLLLFLIALSI